MSKTQIKRRLLSSLSGILVDVLELENEGSFYTALTWLKDFEKKFV